MAISTVKFTVNGTQYSAAYNSTSGKWEATITAPGQTSYNLGGGFYPVTAVAANTAGTSTTVTTADPALGDDLKLVVKETIIPTVAVLSPAAGAHLASSAPGITFQLRDETGGSGVKLSTLQLQLDGTTYNSGSAGMAATPVSGGYDCVFTPQSPLADGAHSFGISVADNDGNVRPMGSRSFTITTVPPVLDASFVLDGTIFEPSDGAYITSSTSVSVSGVTNASQGGDVTVTATVNGVSVGAITVDGAGNFSFTAALSEGGNEIVITATDLAGQTSGETLDIARDTTAPVFTGITITPNPADTGATLIIAAAVT
jgi:hypothetical protein